MRDWSARKQFAVTLGCLLLGTTLLLGDDALKSKLPPVPQPTVQDLLQNAFDRINVLEKEVADLKKAKSPSTGSKPSSSSGTSKGKSTPPKAPPVNEPKELTTSRTFCIACHRSDSSAEKGDDLTIFDMHGKPVLRETRHIELSIKKVENETMPHRDALKQPSPEQRQEILKWLRGLLNKENSK